jgi:hypothetical protein
MTTTTSPAAFNPVAPVFTNTERLVLGGFLAACSGLTCIGPGTEAGSGAYFIKFAALRPR